MQLLPGPKSRARLAFICYLRTGLRVQEDRVAEAAPPLEAKFNPYHDASNGQFTFGPGVGVSDTISDGVYQPLRQDRRTADPRSRPISDGVYRPDERAASFHLVGAESEPPRGIGSNSGALFDPMTLEQVFPGLNATPGGSILAMADNVLKLSGPANDLTRSMSLEYSNALIAGTRQIDPSYRYHTPPYSRTLSRVR